MSNPGDDLVVLLAKEGHTPKQISEVTGIPAFSIFGILYSHGLMEVKYNIENSAENAVLCVYQKNAAKRKYSWKLSRKDFLAITSENCHYCGAPPGNRKKVARDIFIYSGIDRVDNSKGYELGNVVSCCAVCNRAKHTMELVEFMSWIDSLVFYRENFKK